MMTTKHYLACFFALAGACATTAPAPPSDAFEAVPAGWETVPHATRIRAIAYDPAGVLWSVRENDGRCSLYQSEKNLTPLDFCAEHGRTTAGGTLFSSGERAMAVSAAGEITAATDDAQRLDDGSRIVLSRSGTGQPGEWLQRLGGSAATTKKLTPPFPAIESFDLSNQRKEVIFSARRADNFDIGLVSTDGSDIHWIPEDPLDETAVQWAPRGNKVSYTVHAPAGDLVRTVHIPTATPLTADFTPARVRALAWQPAAERYAVILDSIDAAERVDIAKYGGEERRTVIAPSARLDMDSEPLGNATLLRPRTLRYGEKLPLVVWIGEERWNDARAALLQSAHVACAVVAHEPDEAFWAAARQVAWLDVDHSWVVGSVTKSQPANVTVITPDSAAPRGKYAKRDRVVRVDPAIVESFAARFIAAESKGTTPANGSHR